MQKIAKKSIYGFVSFFSIFQTNITEAMFGKEKVKPELYGTEESADQAVQTLITAAMSFLYLLAVIYGLWGGFNILTAAGDEDKVKKGKTVIIHAIIGLIVIWLTGSIIEWVVTQLLGTA